MRNFNMNAIKDFWEDYDGVKAFGSSTMKKGDTMQKYAGLTG